MRIILSPAKKMTQDNDDILHRNLPVFLSKANQLKQILEKQDFQTLKKVWNCSDKLVLENMERLKGMDLKKNLSPAVFSYIGLAYQHLSPNALEEKGLEYLEKHLRILSGFYGVLKPFDGITPYRLEMQAILPDGKDLYSFWNDDIYQEVMDEDRVVINLASKEYSKCIADYLTDTDRMVTIVFAEMINDKLVQKGTMAKMARGEMVYWMAENQIEKVEDIQNFDIHYTFMKEYSNDKEYVFLKENKG